MKLFPRLLTDDNENEYWRVKAKEGDVSVKAFGRQREQAEQLAEELAGAWKASETKGKED